MKKGMSLSAILTSTAFLCTLFSGPCAPDLAVTANADETGTKCATPEQLTLVGEHVVKKGESLWWIAQYEDIFNDPFMWPLIYVANKDHIDNPDRIYPEQILRIPRGGYTIDTIKKARRRAGAPHPYAPPQGSLPPLD